MHEVAAYLVQYAEPVWVVPALFRPQVLRQLAQVSYRVVRVDAEHLPVHLFRGLDHLHEYIWLSDWVNYCNYGLPDVSCPSG